MIYLTHTTWRGWRMVVLALWVPVRHPLPKDRLKLKLQMILSPYVKPESAGTRRLGSGLPVTTAKDGSTASVRECRTKKPRPRLSLALLAPR